MHGLSLRISTTKLYYSIYSFVKLYYLWSYVKRGGILFYFQFVQFPVATLKENLLQSQSWPECMKAIGAAEGSGLARETTLPQYIL